MENTSTQLNQNLIELSTFLVGDALCGMDILTIQEINKLIDMTVLNLSRALIVFTSY